MQIVPLLSGAWAWATAPPRYQLCRHVCSQSSRTFCAYVHTLETCVFHRKQITLYVSVHFTLVVPLEDSVLYVFKSQQEWGMGKCNRSSTRTRAN